MLRKTLTILSLLGLLLSMALWGASYFNFVAVISPSGPAWSLRQGYIAIRWSKLPPLDPLPPDDETRPVGTILLTERRFTMSTMDPPKVKEVTRVTFTTGCTFDGFNNLRTQWLPKLSRILPPVVARLQIPFWIPALAFASMLMLCYLPHRRRRKRTRLGLCLKCGYDLRGSQDRCPECGDEFESSGV